MSDKVRCDKEDNIGSNLTRSSSAAESSDSDTGSAAMCGPYGEDEESSDDSEMMMALSKVLEGEGEKKKKKKGGESRKSKYASVADKLDLGVSGRQDCAILIIPLKNTRELGLPAPLPSRLLLCALCIELLSHWLRSSSATSPYVYPRITADMLPLDYIKILFHCVCRFGKKRPAKRGTREISSSLYVRVAGKM